MGFVIFIALVIFFVWKANGYRVNWLRSRK